jgi:type IV pilus assembly protein PilY1
MKSYRTPALPRRIQLACLIALALGSNGVLLPGHAATSISEVPLINSQVSVKPNLMFILDNSGSMDWDYIPDDIGDTSRYAYWSSHCNGAAFNPDAADAPYERPVTPDGRAYPQMDPSAAWSDGFQPSLVSGTAFNLVSSLNTNTPDPETGAVVTLTLSISANSAPWALNNRIAAYERLSSSSVDRTHWMIGTVTAAKSVGTVHTYTIQFTFSSVRKGNVGSWVIGRQSTVNLTSTTNDVSNRYYYQYTGTEPAMNWKYTSSGAFDTSVAFVDECRSEIGTGAGNGKFTRVNFSELSEANKLRYANWYSYYRKRILMMRSAAGRAMFSLDNRYRVGFTSLNKDGAFNADVTPGLGHFADIGDFDSTKKVEFFSSLYGSAPDGSTPLRRALAKAGRYYGNKFTDQTDPVQHACQRNYSLLTTDGYWNESTNPTQLDGSTSIGNQDGILATSPRPEYDNSQNYTAVERRTNYKFSSSTGCSGSRKRYRSFVEQRDVISVPSGITYSDWAEVPNTTGSEGSCRSSAPSPSNPTTVDQVGGPVSNSLADVAAYYYKTDLRPDLLDSVPYSESDPNRKQHMTTYTLGLGQNGTLPYDANYLNGSSTTYNALVAGTLNWPAPSANDPTTIDDLWHAAVNGHGRYFSASNAANLTNSLSEALSEINAREGAGASAASTSLRPVLGTDQIFIASYRTQSWNGELEARTITRDETTRRISVGVENRDWKASTDLDGREYSGRNIHYLRRTTTGSVSTFSLGDFNFAALGSDADSATLLAHFNDYCGKTPRPSQCSALTSAQQTSAAGLNLVNFLRGDRSNEGSLYRTRRSVLGDMVDASPVYVGKPPFQYQGAGYPTFATAQVNRCPVVYASANDGMLHAFSAKSERSVHADCPDAGTEMWAYVPRAAMARMYMLADKDYANQHRFFMNATPVVGDVSTTEGTTTTWRTVLVGGMGAGGRSYFALDVTDPESPVPLWEFNDADLGLTYGNPIITQVPDASGDLFWAVVFTSGINNSGNGHLYVLNAVTGQIVHKVPTLVAGQAVGDSASPSGLNKLNAWVNTPSDNVASRFYAGDLQGNLWRFDASNLTAPATGAGTIADTRAVRLAQFKIGTAVQPITTIPEVAEVNYGGNRYPIVLVGTGRYLGDPDVLDTTTTHSVYGVRDPLDSTGWADVRASMVEQTLTNVSTDHDNNANTPAIETRKVSRNAVNWSDTQVAGWYIDLPDDGERVAVGMSLAYTTLTVASVVPANDVCSGSGYSWIYDFDISTGSYVSTQAATQTAGYKRLVATMGINTLQFDDNGSSSSGQTITNADGTVEVREGETPTASTSLRRTSWRELTP